MNEMFFRTLAPHLGPALHVFRVAKQMTQEDVAAALANRTGTPCGPLDIHLIEQGATLTDERSFGLLCEVLGKTQMGVFKCAQLLQDNEARPEHELLQELQEEVDYRLWQKDQEDGTLPSG